MQRKFNKVGNFSDILNPPRHSPIWGHYECLVCYEQNGVMVLPEGLGRNQPIRIERMQNGLLGFKLIKAGHVTLLEARLAYSEKQYFLSSLKQDLQLTDRHLQLDSGLLLRLYTEEDLIHALSVLHKRYQLDPNTKADLEATLQIKIEMTAIDAKILFLEGKFEEVYAASLRASSAFCNKMGRHVLKHYRQHTEWAIKILLAARVDEDNHFDFGYAYVYALKHIAELVLRGDDADFNVFDHVDFATLYSIFTTPSKYSRVTHYDFLYYLGVYCRAINEVDNAIRCFNAVPVSDPNYSKACDELLHFEMQGYKTFDNEGQAYDKVEQMLRYALKGIPENRWMAQTFFMQLCGAALSPQFPSVNTDIDSLVALAKYIRNVNNENKELKAKLVVMESELKKYKAEDTEVSKGATLFARKTIKVIVASKSQLKMDAVILALGDPETYQVIGVDVPSGVNEQPVNEETQVGAHNRVENAMKLINSGDIYIAIENGVYEDHGKILDKAVITVKCRHSDNSCTVYEAFSDALEFPKECFDIAKARGFEKTTVADVMLEQGLIESSKDPHKSLGEKISRAVILKNALRQMDLPNKYKQGLKMMAGLICK